jgi:syntaxin-binding protein 5
LFKDRPLAVRTIEENDVNVVDGNKLDSLPPKDLSAEGLPTAPPVREPIFKLAWSGFQNSTDPRGGETALTILGGLAEGNASGVTVLWLPAFNAPEPPAGAEHVIHPVIRNAMRDSVMPSKSFYYPTTGVTQDFFLFARDSPHFSGSCDPVSILLLSEAEGKSCTVECYQFPPPLFLAIAPPIAPESTSVESDSGSPSDSLSKVLASTLESMELCQDPVPLRLVTSLATGNGGVIDAQSMKLERSVYQQLSSDTNADSALPLKGGCAWADEMKTDEMKFEKVCYIPEQTTILSLQRSQYQPHRILITYHRDFRIQFQDISAQLLTSSRPNPIKHYFPHPLPSLTIDLVAILTDPLVATRLPTDFLEQARLASVQLAMESLECLIGFKSGELLVYRFTTSSKQDTSFREASDKELTILDHLPRDQHKRFFPYLMLAPGRGPLVASSISDIGEIFGLFDVCGNIHIFGQVFLQRLMPMGPF